MTDSPQESTQQPGTSPTPADVERPADQTEVDSPGDLGAPLRSREERIRDAAYAAYERRGREPGREADDWFEAERVVDAESLKIARK